MDCLQAREIMSEAFDLGIEDTPLAAEARVHCRGCAECAAFAAGLASMHNPPGPKAPAELVDAILERTRKMAEIDKEAASFAAGAGGDPTGADTQETPPTTLPVPASPNAPERRDAWWWGWRVGGGLAAAAVAVVALSLAYQGFRSIGAPGGASSAPAPAVTEGVPQPGTPAPPASAPATPNYDAGKSVSGAARFVSYNDQAFLFLGVRQPDAAGIDTAGTLTSSLDTADTPKQFNVWRSKDDADLIFIQETADATGYAAFRRVMRTLAGKQFALDTPASQVTGYGQWSALPSTYTTPTAADGSPTFVEAGKDDSGLTIYAPKGASPNAGFAIAPGTNVADPAAGDPNWTWWVPKH